MELIRKFKIETLDSSMGKKRSSNESSPRTTNSFLMRCRARQVSREKRDECARSHFLADDKFPRSRPCLSSRQVPTVDLRYGRQIRNQRQCFFGSEEHWAAKERDSRFGFEIFSRLWLIALSWRGKLLRHADKKVRSTSMNLRGGNIYLGVIMSIRDK